MPLPAESAPAILPLASGFTELALPIRDWAFEGVGCRANSAATANTAVHLWLYIIVAPLCSCNNVTLLRGYIQPCHHFQHKIARALPWRCDHHHKKALLPPKALISRKSLSACSNSFQVAPSSYGDGIRGRKK